MVKVGCAPGRTHPTDRTRGQTTAMPAAVAASWQPHPDHPLVRVETAASGPSNALSLQKTPSDPCSTSATVILDVIYPMRCDRLWTAMRQRSILRLGTRVLRFQQREPKRRLGSDTRICYGEWSPSSANVAPQSRNHTYEPHPIKHVTLTMPRSTWTRRTKGRTDELRTSSGASAAFSEV